jgi:hypothetical protein
LIFGGDGGVDEVFGDLLEADGFVAVATGGRAAERLAGAVGEAGVGRKWGFESTRDIEAPWQGVVERDPSEAEQHQPTDPT